jgi:VanZ family protein
LKCEEAITAIAGWFLICVFIKSDTASLNQARSRAAIWLFAMSFALQVQVLRAFALTRGAQL